MSFVEESESIRSKLHLGKVSVRSLAGAGIMLAMVLVLGFQMLWGAFLGEGELFALDETNVELEVEQAVDPEESKSIFVHVAGEVTKPGLYELDAGSRVAEAIEAAGGLTDKAEQTSINLARELEDGEQLVVAGKGEGQATAASSATGSGGASAAGTTSGQSAGGLVNINTASASELTSLNGIGEATAAKIVAWREANGRFKNIKELTQVSGIGEKKFEAIKSQITV